MLSILLKIHEKGDAPLFPEFDTFTCSEVTHACVLEGGMTSGATSIGIITAADGKNAICVEMSLVDLQQLYHAAMGADARFIEKKRNRGN